MSASILVVDDETAFAEAVALRLSRDGHAATVAGSLRAARATLAEGAIDLMLLDMRLPDGTGLDLLAELAAEAPATVAVTAFGDLDNAVAAMKAGAVDYLRKPLDLDELALVVERVLDSLALRRRLDYSQEREAHADAGAALLGESEAMVAVRREIETIAAIAGEQGMPPPNVLLLGETGTGKDIAAHLIHGLGPRAGRPFVRIDCAGLRHQHADRELFGGDGPGLLEAAEDGTVFLDEVGDLAPDSQAKLLTVLERRRFGRPGGRREHALAARFVAGSNRDIVQAVREGGFRADLFYRLDVLRVRMPALRHCAGDAALLARHFLAETARRYGRAPPRLSPAAAAALARYDWPGNVRELAHMIERAVLLDRSGVLGVGDLPLATPDVESAASLAEAERLIMARALEQTAGNVSAAARALGITRMTMRYRMRKHGL